jgi:hypothetical protein
MYAIARNVNADLSLRISQGSQTMIFHELLNSKLIVIKAAISQPEGISLTTQAALLTFWFKLIHNLPNPLPGLIDCRHFSSNIFCKPPDGCHLPGNLEFRQVVIKEKDSPQASVPVTYPTDRAFSG